MVGSKLRALVAAWACALSVSAASHAHRMPEVYITLETSSVGGENVTGATVRLETEDALVMAVDAFGETASLDQQHVQEVLLKRIATAMVTEGESFAPLGFEPEGNFVFLYFEGAPDITVRETRVLSSVYDSWTNYIRDERAEETSTRMFTQRGPMQDHHH